MSSRARRDRPGIRGSAPGCSGRTEHRANLAEHLRRAAAGAARASEANASSGAVRIVVLLVEPARSAISSSRKLDRRLEVADAALVRRDGRAGPPWRPRRRSRRSRRRGRAGAPCRRPRRGPARSGRPAAGVLCRASATSVRNRAYIASTPDWISWLASGEGPLQQVGLTRQAASSSRRRRRCRASAASPGSSG